MPGNLNVSVNGIEIDLIVPHKFKRIQGADAFTRQWLYWTHGSSIGEVFIHTVKHLQQEHIQIARESGNE